MSPEDELPPLHKALADDDWDDIRSERITWGVLAGNGSVSAMAPSGKTAYGRSPPRALSALWQQLA